MKKNKSILFIMLTVIFLATLPAGEGQISSRQVKSFAYLVAAPNPVGVNQPVNIYMWVDLCLPQASVTNDIRRTGYKLTIIKPDGMKIVREWPVVQDTTGIQFTTYVPDQVGTYALTFEYAGQVYTWNATAAMRAWTGTIFLPANRTIYLIVREEVLPEPIKSFPLPREYWTRPIEGQNTDWWTITSHWLGGAYLGSFQIFSGYDGFSAYNLWQKDGIAPDSPHIMWTMPIEFGGVVGGSVGYIPGVTYYSGGSYEGRFYGSIIMHGRLYFELPLGHSGHGGGWVCVDLRTGEKIWHNPKMSLPGTRIPTFGQLYDFESENQHGVVGGVIWQVFGTTWVAYDAWTGQWMFNLTNVPSGFTVYTQKGEICRYVLNYGRRWLALWNNTRGNGLYTGTNRWRPLGKVIDASKMYSWNVTIPSLPGDSTPTIFAVLPGDVILGTSSRILPGVTAYPRGTPNPYVVWALSDQPETRGRLLWIRNYTMPDDYAAQITRQLGPLDPVNRVWMMYEVETMQWLGYSLDTGNLMWGPTNIEFLSDFQFFGSGEGAGQRGVVAYGNLYIQGYGGEIICLNTKTGKVIWRYNGTFSGLQTPWGYMPIQIAAIADGKVYAFNNEHSPNSPYYKGYKIYCIDAFTGKEIWTLPGWAGHYGGRGASTAVLAEGFFVYYNYYDNQIYCIGKGPTKTTVEAPSVGVYVGSTIVIRGTVIDISPGTANHEQKCRFPNGVPAVSDESMGEWMAYVYMQKPRPENMKGVWVKLDAVNVYTGEYIDIGGTFTDPW
ncbi:MAG: PQQ-binding-like beta-propeller repeat protein, partial [Thermoproteota archaeon]